MTDRERGENTRGRWDRIGDQKADPITVAQAAYRFANDHGPVALIAVAAIGFMAYLWMTQLSTMATDLHDHVRDTSHYQRQMCLNLAILAGTSPAFCDPPR